MIGSLTGTIGEQLGDAIILHVGDVGYRVEIPGLVPVSDTPVTLYIYTHVREQELRLFGFETRQQLLLFEQLLTVSGVGPKAALSLLGTHSYEHLVNAIVSDEAKQLKAPGVGKKTAERIVLDLQSKLKQAASADTAQGHTRGSTEAAEVASALHELGFSEPEIEAVLPRIDTEGAQLHDMIKQALKLIQQA